MTTSLAPRRDPLSHTLFDIIWIKFSKKVHLVLASVLESLTASSFPVILKATQAYISSGRRFAIKANPSRGGDANPMGLSSREVAGLPNRELGPQGVPWRRRGCVLAFK